MVIAWTRSKHPKSNENAFVIVSSNDVRVEQESRWMTGWRANLAQRMTNVGKYA
jgi:hypothetical protein